MNPQATFHGFLSALRMLAAGLSFVSFVSVLHNRRMRSWSLYLKNVASKFEP